MSTEETELFFTDVFSSRSSERTLWALDVTPELLQRMFLQSAATTLTTLELHWKLTSDRFPRACCTEDLADAPGLLHQFLCNSDLLVHLTTLKTAVRLEDLDLFSRGGYINLHRDLTEILEDRLLDDPPSPTTPKIWRSRSLRTLHINLHAPGLHRLRHSVHSRIIFGYISRLCPLLERLQIHVPQECQSRVYRIFYDTNFHLGLDGGLVLLGRLQSLQSLRVWSPSSYMTSNCEEWELSWMVPSGRSSFLAKRRRRKAAEGWKGWRVKEDILDADRLPLYIQDMENESGHKSSSSSNSRSGGGSTYVVKTEAEILRQLHNLGLLLDVEEMLKEMETNKNFRPLPALEKLSFSLPFMKRPEEELRLLFPSAFKKWRNHRVERASKKK